MTNTFFSIDGPEKDDEVYSKWLRPTLEERKRLTVPKSRIYVSVEDIDLIQGAFESVLSEGFRSESEKRKVMQMGYALERIKTELKKRIEKENK